LRNKWISIFIILLLISVTGVTVVSADTILESEKDVFSIGLRAKIWWKLHELRRANQELHDMMEEFGFNLPDLTAAQKRELFITARYLHINDASREDIRDELKTLLIEFGVDLPNLSEEEHTEIKADIHEVLEANGFVIIELTEQQRIQIKNTVNTLVKQGAYHDEIHDEVFSILEGFGFVIPELSDEERISIRQDISDILRNHGIDIPELSLDQHQQLYEKNQEIKQLRFELFDLKQEKRTRSFFF